MKFLLNVKPARLFVTVLSTISLCLSGVAHAGILDYLTKSNDKPIVLDASSDMKKTMALAIKESDPIFKTRGDKITKIGISAFQVRFITDSSLSQTKKNIGSGNEVRAAVQYKLEVPPLEVYQRVTDQMRAQLEEEIRARGYEIIPAEKLAEDSGFAQKVSSTPNVSNNEAGFFSKTGEIVVHAKGTADTFGIMQGANEMRLAERFGSGAAMLKVSLLVNFASMEEMGFVDRALAGADAGIKHKVGLSIDAIPASNSPSHLALGTPLGVWPMPIRSKIYLNNPIAKNVEKLNESTSEAAIGFLKSLAGGTSSGTRYLVTPADDYEAQLTSGLGLSMKLLSESLPDLR